MKKFLLISIIISFSGVLWAQQKSDIVKTETQQFNLEEFEIIHLTSGVKGETNIKVESKPKPGQQTLSREEREQAMRRLQEIRTAMRTIESDTTQQNPELKALSDKINELQEKRKALLDEILADNFEYQQLKQKIASGNFQSSDTMRLAAIERQASQDQRIREIDQQIRDLYQQRQTLVQKTLQENQDYQSLVSESQSIMQSFRASFQGFDSTQQTGFTGRFNPPNTQSTDSPQGRWRRNSSGQDRTN